MRGKDRQGGIEYAQRRGFIPEAAKRENGNLKSTLSQEESQGCLGSREEVLGKKLQLRFFVPLTLWLLASVPTVF